MNIKNKKIKLTISIICLLVVLALALVTFFLLCNKRLSSVFSSLETKFKQIGYESQILLEPFQIENFMIEQNIVSHGIVAAVVADGGALIGIEFKNQSLSKSFEKVINKNENILGIKRNRNIVYYSYIEDYVKIVTNEIIKINNAIYLILEEQAILLKVENVKDVFSVPSIVKEKPVTKIAYRAFAGSEISKVILSENIQNVGVQSFMACANLTEVETNYNLKEVKDRAFAFCPRIEKLQFKEQTTVFGNSCFEECSNLKKLEFLGNVKILGKQLLFGCNALEQIKLTSLSYFADENALYNFNKTEIVKYFSGKIAKTYQIPKTVKTIKFGAFYSSIYLTHVTLENECIINVIEDKAFSNCIKLSSVDVTKNAEHIGEYAFAYSNNILKLSFQNISPPIIFANSFTSIVKLHVANISNYLNNNNWKAFSSQLVEAV